MRPPPLQTAWRYLGPATLEVDLYRRQRLFPPERFRLLTILCRSMLSCSMMLCYPLQTGKLHCALIRWAGGPWVGARAAAACCVLPLLLL